MKPGRKLNIKIRRAKKDDLSKILYLGRKIEEFISSEQTKFYNKDELIGFIKKPKNNIFLVALDNNKLTGFLYAKIISNHWCMIDNVCVDSRYRRQKVGSKLLENLYFGLKKKGIDYVQAVVGIEYKKTRKFWENKGFKEGKKLIWIEKSI